MRCPWSLADASDGIDVIDASELGDGGFECLDLLIPDDHIYTLHPGDFALLIEFVCEDLGALGVSVSDEDFGTKMVLVWIRRESKEVNGPSTNEHRGNGTANAAGTPYIDYSTSRTLAGRGVRTSDIRASAGLRHD